MKLLIIIFLTLLLTACTITPRVYKSDEDIRREAFDISEKMGWRKANGKPLEIVVFSVVNRIPFPLRRSRSDEIKLRNLLLTLKKHPNYILIYFIENPGLDYRIISGALKDLQLDGVKFFLVARSNKKRFEPLIKASGADFVFIKNNEKPDKYIEWTFF